MKQKIFKKKKKGIAERKTATPKKKPIRDLPIQFTLMGILLLSIVVYLFYGHGIVRHIDLAEGQQAPSTMVASVDFKCQNLKETAFGQSKAAATIPPTFIINPAPMNNALQLVNKLFERLDSYYAVEAEQKERYINSLGDLLTSTGITSTDFITLFPSNTLKKAEKTLTLKIADVMKKGILSDQYLKTFFHDSATKRLTIKNATTDSVQIVKKSEISSTDQAKDQVKVEMEPLLEENLNTLLQLLNVIVQENLTYDQEQTELARKNCANSIPPVIQEYSAGTTLIKAGEKATKQHILLLQKHEEKRQKQQDNIETIMQVIGNSLRLSIGLITAIIILAIISPCTIKNGRHLLLLAILSLLPLTTGKLFLYLSTQYSLISPALIMYIVPHALAVVLAGVLIGANPAICLGLWTSFATAVLFDSSFNVFALGILITITATCTARNVHRRANLFRAGMWVCVIEVLYVLIAYIINSPTTPVLIGQLWAAAFSGLISTVFALLLIPIFEKLFNVTTDITLLELSDMGHPLLQKMAIQAPGTYHHSLMVSTLAQNAAERIGANSLLVRVCAYYHDIGKLAKPDFFTENIQQKENPHDELSPHMSALVITSHVKEGLTLAKRNRLPQPILDAIEQHHGNGLIAYFYHKAKMQNTEGVAEKINEADFRYGGHPAVSQEMAILCLADATEAASRSLEKPTPQKINNLVEDIFSAKIRDGQLSSAKLTMQEITAIKESFIFSLSNMLHGRIPYPKDDENNNKQPTEKTDRTDKKSSKPNHVDR